VWSAEPVSPIAPYTATAPSGLPLTFRLVHEAERARKSEGRCLELNIGEQSGTSCAGREYRQLLPGRLEILNRRGALIYKNHIESERQVCGGLHDFLLFGFLGPPAS